ncbi:hypothetical protein [Amycolatopsis decaplanina]
MTTPSSLPGNVAGRSAMTLYDVRFLWCVAVAFTVTEPLASRSRRRSTCTWARPSTGMVTGVASVGEKADSLRAGSAPIRPSSTASAPRCAAVRYASALFVTAAISTILPVRSSGSVLPSPASTTTASRVTSCAPCGDEPVCQLSRPIDRPPRNLSAIGNGCRVTW